MECSGRIGYSVRPSERRKGIATAMLRLFLPFYCAAGEKRVVITCAKENIASRKVIEANDGQLENEVPDSIGISHSGTILRFWIQLLISVFPQMPSAQITAENVRETAEITAENVKLIW